ncbi:MAG: DUF4234 domain-containing protein [Lachnospiraceae bacterium]
MREERSIALSIVLSIITCGIYGLYWIAVLNDETLADLGEQGTSGGMVVLLSIITCNIYGWYWMYQLGDRVDRLNSQNGKVSSNSSILYLLLSIFGLNIVALAIAQNEMNSINANRFNG